MKTLMMVSLVAVAVGCSTGTEQTGATGKTGTEQTSSNAEVGTDTGTKKVEIKTVDDIEAKKLRAEEIKTEAAVLMNELVELKKQEAAQGPSGFGLVVDPADLQAKIADIQAKLLDLAAEAQVLAADLQAAAQDLAADLLQMAMDLAADLQNIAMDIANAAMAGDVAGVQQGLEDLIAALPAGVPGLPGLPGLGTP